MSDKELPETETYVMGIEELGGIWQEETVSDDFEIEETRALHEKTEFQPENVSVNTQIVCPHCGGKTYLRDKKCPICDYGLRI